MSHNKHKEKKSYRIVEIVISIILIVYILFFLVGSIQYYASEIQDASWQKISFYSCLILFIVFKLGEFFNHLFNHLFKRGKHK